jgi:hypothetical protein
MKASWRRGLGPGFLPVLALAAVFWLPLTAAAQQPARVWNLEAAEATADGRARLSYGAPETDDTIVRFSCAPRHGVLNVFIPHTGRRMTRGAKATARLAAGRTRLSLAGKILANDESLDESFSGSAPFDPSRFQGLTQGARLNVTVGRGPAQTTPLIGADEKFRRFARLCAKP